MTINTSEVRHYYNQARQFLFVLPGTATLEINGEHLTLIPKEGIEIPLLTPHLT